MSSAEFEAMLDLLTMLVFNWRTGLLLLLLIWAAISDIRSHRIPNWLILFGLLFGVFYNTVFPLMPHNTILWPLAGLSLGLMLFLPLYLLRVMGAGDVKLAAMIGAILGPGDTFYAMLASMIVGGVLAVGYVLAKGTATKMLRNLGALFQLGFLSVIGGSKPELHIAAASSAGKMPYGVSIAIGTIGYLLLRQLGFI
jgi:prepilin peptidase CpaA